MFKNVLGGLDKTRHAAAVKAQTLELVGEYAAFPSLRLQRVGELHLTIFARWGICLLYTSPSPRD